MASLTEFHIRIRIDITSRDQLISPKLKIHVNRQRLNLDYFKTIFYGNNWRPCFRKSLHLSNRDIIDKETFFAQILF